MNSRKRVCLIIGVLDLRISGRVPEIFKSSYPRRAGTDIAPGKCKQPYRWFSARPPSKGARHARRARRKSGPVINAIKSSNVQIFWRRWSAGENYEVRKEIACHVLRLSLFSLLASPYGSWASIFDKVDVSSPAPSNHIFLPPHPRENSCRTCHPNFSAFFVQPCSAFTLNFAFATRPLIDHFTLSTYPESFPFPLAVRGLEAGRTRDIF